MLRGDRYRIDGERAGEQECRTLAAAREASSHSKEASTIRRQPARAAAGLVECLGADIQASTPAEPNIKSRRLRARRDFLHGALQQDCIWSCPTT